MSSVVDREPELKTVRRRLRQFDSVAAFLQTLIVLASIAVLILLLLWLASQVWPAHAPTQAMEILQLDSGEEEGMAGDDPELGEAALPNPEESPMREESLEFEDTEIAQVLSSVLDSVSPNEIDLSDPSQQSGKQGSGTPGAPGGQGKEGSGSGKGGVPNYARWDIRYPGQSVNDYAAALDYFGIELGVIRGTDVTTVSNLSQATPVIKRGSGSDNRLYFQWQDAGRRKADIDLLRQKGVAVSGATIVQFIPAGLEKQLAEIERKEAKQPVERIRKTRFGVRSTGNKQYEFYVIDINYMR